MRPAEHGPVLNGGGGGHGEKPVFQADTRRLGVSRRAVHRTRIDKGCQERSSPPLPPPRPRRRHEP
eukprot:scaffold315093_cov32-Tisochrysis_lutea.AAC.2